MILLNSLFNAVIYVVDALIYVYFFIVIGACLVTWVNADPYNPIVRILRTLTEPVLWRIRKVLPFTYAKGIDFSPVVLLLGLQVFAMLLTGLIRQLQVTLLG